MVVLRKMMREMVPDSLIAISLRRPRFFTGNLQSTRFHRTVFFYEKEARPLLASLQSRNRYYPIRTLTSSGEAKLGYKGVDGLDRAAENTSLLRRFMTKTSECFQSKCGIWKLLRLPLPQSKKLVISTLCRNVQRTHNPINGARRGQVSHGHSLS